jgi:hypothetical protein
MAEDKRQNELTMADSDSGQTHEGPDYDAPVQGENDYTVRIWRDGYISCQRMA